MDKQAIKQDVLAETETTLPPENQEEDDTDLDDILFFSIFMAGGSLILYVLLALIEALSFLWSPLSIACYFFVLIVASFIMYVYLAESEFTKEENAPFHLSMTLLAIIIAIVSFSQISRHTQILVGGFSANRLDYWHWLRFGISQLLDTSLFNMPSIYQWNISEIQPTHFVTRSFTFLFNLCIEIFIVAVAIQRLQVARKRWQKRKASQHVSYFDFLLTRAKTWIFIAIWGMPFALFLGAIVRDGFSLEGAWSAILVSTPVVLGIWLIWYSILALALPGIKNRLVAILIILASSALLSTTLPHFVSFLAPSK